MKTVPRGIRNNNPLNLRHGKGRFYCEIPLARCNDSKFRQFESMEWGLRAAFVTLRTYAKKYHVRRVRHIVQRWAPPNENKTSANIEKVCQLTGFTPDRVIDWSDEDGARLVWAMAKVECGVEIPMTTILDAQKLAIRI